MIINHVLSIKGIVLVVHITLVKPNVMQKLDRMNIIIGLKVQNHQNTFKVTSTTMLRPGRTYKHHIVLSGNLILLKKRTLKDQFSLEVVAHRTVNDIMQTPKKEVHFFFFSVVLFLIALDN